MFERSIEFHGPESIIHDKEILPIPANKNIPAWYRDLVPHTNIGNPHGRGVGTLKKCLPVLDALTAGYILKSHQDVFINFNFYNEETKTQDLRVEGPSSSPVALQATMLKHSHEINWGHDYHPPAQLGGDKCPFVKQNSNLPFVKLVNTWRVVTPKGYSTFYLPIINNGDPRFTPLSGIVDTDDDFYLSSNFPIIIHKQGKFTIKKGTPIVAVFPFKRDSWKMKIKKIDPQKSNKQKVDHSRVHMHWYKDLFWKQKKWK